MINALSSYGLIPHMNLPQTFEPSSELVQLWSGNGMNDRETILRNPSLPEQLSSNLAAARERLSVRQRQSREQAEDEIRRIKAELPPDRATLALNRGPRCQKCGSLEEMGPGASVSL